MRHHSTVEDGFTLVELLVVVIVIGLLAAIAIPTYLRQREAAYLASLQNDLRTAVVAVESAAFETGSYAVLDGADQTTSALISRGYEGAENTVLTVFATSATYCVEAEDLRSPGIRLIARHGVAGFARNDAGC